MSIYKRDFGFDFNFRILKWPAVAIGIIIAVIAVYWGLMLLLQPQAIMIRYENNPLDLKDSNNALMYITATNVTENDVENARISLEAVDKESIVVFPEARIIGTMAKGENRILSFTVSPNLAPVKEIYSGDYVVNIKLYLGDEVFEAKATITIRA